MNSEEHERMVAEPNTTADTHTEGELPTLGEVMRQFSREGIRIVGVRINGLGNTSEPPTPMSQERRKQLTEAALNAAKLRAARKKASSEEADRVGSCSESWTACVRNGLLDSLWTPATAPEDLRATLAVRLQPSHQQPPSKAEYLDALVDKMDRLVQESEDGEAVPAMDQGPNLTQIAADYPKEMWGRMIVDSDQMAFLLNRIDWSKEPTAKPVRKMEIREMLDEQTLRSALEML